jgi:hypothetical protein
MQPERSRENKTHHTQRSFKLSFWVWVLWMSIRVSVVGLMLESHLFVGVGFCFFFVLCERRRKTTEMGVLVSVCR